MVFKLFPTLSALECCGGQVKNHDFTLLPVVLAYCILSFIILGSRSQKKFMYFLLKYGLFIQRCPCASVHQKQVCFLKMPVMLKVSLHSQKKSL